MNRINSQSIGNVLQEVLQEPRFCEKLNEVRVVESWSEVVDESVISRTQNVYVSRRKLYVKVTSPALKSNLLMRVSELVNTINERVGENVIDSIVLL